MSKLHRSAVTGEFTTPEDAELHPDVTVAETVEPAFTAEHLNALGALASCANKHGIREAIRRLRD